MSVTPKEKRVILGLVIIILMFSLSACGGQGSSKGDSAQPAGHLPSKNSGLVAESAESKPHSAEQTDKISKQEQLDKEEQVLAYLEKTVPEVKEFGRNIEDYNKESNTNCRLIVRIDAVPDSRAADALARDFYCIYVGSDMGTHTSRWNSFYVKQDLTAVLVENLAGGVPLTLEQWRQLGGEPPAD